MMPLTGDQIDMVKKTMSMLEFEKFGPRYYHLLFKAHPEYRDWYGQDLAETIARYLGVLDLSVNSLEQSSEKGYHFHAPILDPLKNLGERHQLIGIQADHYQIAINIFIEALRQELVGTWSDEVEHSWRLLFQHITYWMNQTNS